MLPAELPDKTVLACLVMGSRYRPAFVFAGAAAAFTAHVALAVTAGSLLGLLPHRPTQVVAGVLLLFGAVLLWRQQGRDSSDDVVEHGRPPAPAGRGDGLRGGLRRRIRRPHQILTVSLAVRYGDPLAVGIGSVLALWVASGGAIIGGRSLLKVIPMTWLARGAALVMLVLGGASVVTALS